MNSVAHQNPATPTTCNCGNVTGSFNKVRNNCDISVSDEKRVILEWISPLEPWERHHAIGKNRMAGVGDWLLITNEFTQWKEDGGGTTKPVLLCYGNPGVGKDIS